MADNKNTPKPKPSAKPTAPKVEAKVEAEVEVEAETFAIYDALIEEAPLPVAAEPAYTEKVEEPARDVPKTAYAVVSNDRVDSVFASKIVPHNLRQKKSLSVHHLQRRLNEWGFTTAYLDKDGYCGDPTLTAITEFQRANGLPVTGLPDYETLERVFEGDTNVKLAP